MSLRASYASIMLAKHRAGETLGGMTEVLRVPLQDHEHFN